MNDEKSLALLPTQDEWSKIKEIAKAAFDSKLLPESVKTAEMAAIIALKGYELGLKPMVAFSHIYVVNGKPATSSELMLACIRKEYPKAQIKFEEMTEKKCVIKAKRPEDEAFTEISMTFEQAKSSGFTTRWDYKKDCSVPKDNWIKMPKVMLKWRCVAEMKRTLFPEVLMGLDYVSDELEPTEAKEVKEVIAEVVPPVSDQIKSVDSIAVPAETIAVPVKTLVDPPGEFEKFANGGQKESAQKPKKTRSDLIKDVMSHIQRLKIEDAELTEMVQYRYKTETKLMDVPQLQDFLSYLEGIKS